MTGAFSQSRTAVAPPSRNERTVAQVGFGTEAAEEPATQRKKEPSTVVASGGFGDATSPTSSTGKSTPRGSVASTGFEAQGVAQSSRRPPSGTVQAGSFGSEVVAAKPTRPRQLELETLDTPVEILSKPKPAYTEEAREARIEGEVVLEVTFVASGQLRVLRILERLGHGLDEAAVAATNKIQFKPARRNGRAVDHTATLRVVFRLA
jgi:TonB family protein